MRRVRSEESGRFQELMQAHHDLGALGKMGETLWSVAIGAAEGPGDAAGPGVRGAMVKGAIEKSRNCTGRSRACNCGN